MTGLYLIAGLAVIPLIACALYVHRRFDHLYRKYSKEPVRSGITGGRLARTMLRSAGVKDVVVEEIDADLKDHYDPRHKVIRLSRSVSRSASVAAIGIAAHEAAHAIQDGTGYPPLKLRNRIAPIAQGAGYLLLPVLFFGVILGSRWSPFFLDVAIVLFLGIVVFYLVTLPIEFQASSRAMRYIKDNGVVDDNELHGVGQVLKVAALTYVVAAALALGQFLRLLGAHRRR